MDKLQKRIDQTLPNCPVTGKLSFATKRLPEGFRVCSGGRWLKSYKCKHCPYYHQTKS